MYLSPTSCQLRSFFQSKTRSSEDNFCSPRGRIQDGQKQLKSFGFREVQPCTEFIFFKIHDNQKKKKKSRAGLDPGQVIRHVPITFKKHWCSRVTVCVCVLTDSAKVALPSSDKEFFLNLPSINLMCILLTVGGRLSEKPSKKAQIYSLLWSQLS